MLGARLARAGTGRKRGLGSQKFSLQNPLELGKLLPTLRCPPSRLISRADGVRKPNFCPLPTLSPWRLPTPGADNAPKGRCHHPTPRVHVESAEGAWVSPALRDQGLARPVAPRRLRPALRAWPPRLPLPLRPHATGCGSLLVSSLSWDSWDSWENRASSRAPATSFQFPKIRSGALFYHNTQEAKFQSVCMCACVCARRRLFG